MTTKAISFLGYTKPDQSYRTTTYVYGEQECETDFMAEATARFFQHEITELLVLVTKEAYEQNFADLEQAIGCLVPVRPVRIPSGRDEAELWDMFSAIEQQITVNDCIIFDITNGFRSLPVLALLAASFVRVARGATVERMIYGAFDATQHGRTPVFDLTPFVRLLDWTTATDAFLRYGRADALTALAGAETPIAQRLSTLTAALQTSRPAEIMETAHELEDAVAAARRTDDLQQRPFGLLFDQILEEYAPFGLRRPRDMRVARQSLSTQLATIRWYREKQLYVQALTAAREWIVSLVVVEAGLDMFAKRQRGQAEKLLWEDTSNISPDAIPRLDAIRAVWRQATQVRNSVAHAGMSHDAPKAKTIEAHVVRICDEIEKLVEQNEP